MTPAAEYNIWADPKAAPIVFSSGLPLEMVGRGPAVLNAADIEHVLSLGTALAEFAIECNSFAQEAYRLPSGEHGISLPDPVCMSIAIDPSICTNAGSHYVQIETRQ